MQFVGNEIFLIWIKIRAQTAALVRNYSVYHFSLGTSKQAASIEGLIEARWYNSLLYCWGELKVVSFVLCVWLVSLTFNFFKLFIVVSEQRKRQVDCLYFKYWFTCLLFLVLFLRNLNITFCLYRLSSSVFLLRRCGIGTRLQHTWLHRTQQSKDSLWQRRRREGS